MWRPLPLHHRLKLFFSVAPADFSTAIATTTSISMFSPSPYRDGRKNPRRSFSDRPYTGGGRGPYVSGDSHFRSIREANLGFRQGEESHSGFPMRERPPHPDQNHHQFRPRFYRNHHQPRQFRSPPPPYDYQNQRFPRSPAPPFEQNQPRRAPQQFQPRPRPPDFRNWEFAKAAPPSSAERFTIVSYNILADYLAMEHRSKLYYHVPRYMLDWQWRKRSIMFELGLWSTDIICLQEVDRFQELEEELKLRGYGGIWKRRTGYPVDGCAIFWQASRFKLLYEESIEFGKLGLRDNVAQICVLELLSQNCDENAAPLQTSGAAMPDDSTASPTLWFLSHFHFQGILAPWLQLSELQRHLFYTLPIFAPSAGSNKVVICNIHVLYNPKRGEIKLGQVRTLLDRAHAVSKIWNDAPIVLCGDFNCVPKSPLYNYILEQKLDLSELDRDKVSGQASAEIQVQGTYNPVPYIKSGDNLVGAPSVVHGSEVVKMNESSLELQKQFNLDRSLENVPLVENISQSHSSNALNPCERSSTTAKHAKDDKVDNEVKEETQQISVHGPCDRGSRSTCDNPGTGLREDINTSYSEGDSLADNFNDEKMDYSHNGLFSRSAEPNNYSEEESMNDDNSCQSLPEVICSSTVKTNAEEYCQTSSSYALDISFPQTSGDSYSQQICSDEQCVFSGTSQALSFSSTSIEVQEKLDNLSLDVLDETIIGGGNVAEDSSIFLSALHDNEEAFSCDSGQLLRSGALYSDSSKGFTSGRHNTEQHLSNNELEDDLSPDLDPEPLDVEKNIYDPSLWTPMEIETATGNAGCTSLEHPLKLRSTYTEVEDCLGTRDSNGEPLVTSYNRCFLGTLDYIWRSEGLQTVRVLSPIPKHVMQTTPGFPTKKWGSDHIALASELAFVKDHTNHRADV
ncbi:Endonuclease/exonuclease/phosphatase [Parasponia andersonii]|uniref:Endonuclease/exonuclease/phosphatase n=1 Tax=Parasponia andersonii TaxID=3476 RepID=A0A2P5CA60_PARAD|nr:Endonuclease/exonuclease/phosphatase [Parasponia andersonii]